MKDGWVAKTLGEVCQPDKIQALHRGLAYVGMEHVESHTGNFIGSYEPCPVKSSTFKFTLDHLLFGRLRPYLNKVMVPDFVGHCSTEIIPIRPKPGHSRQFLRYWLIQQEIVGRINATCTGTRMPRASVHALLGFEILIPSLQEQQRIVRILDEAFESIATVKANTEKNLQNARLLARSTLRAILASSDPSWKRTSLGSQITLQRGFDVTKEQQRPGQIPVISSGGIRSFHDTAMVDGPGVVIGRKGTLGNVFYVDSEFWPHDTTLWVKQFNGNCPRFVYHFFRGLDVRKLDTVVCRVLCKPVFPSWKGFDF